MPAHASSEKEHYAWRTHPFSLEGYWACCLERHVTSSPGSLMADTTCERTPWEEVGRCRVGRHWSTVRSEPMRAASPHQVLGYMQYFNFNVLNLSIFLFDLCFMFVWGFFNSFTSMLKWLSLIPSLTHLVFMVFYIHLEFVFCMV